MLLMPITAEKEALRFSRGDNKRNRRDLSMGSFPMGSLPHTSFLFGNAFRFSRCDHKSNGLARSMGSSPHGVNTPE